MTAPTGASAGIRNVLRLIEQVAAHDSSVLILGESGTGKEVVARAIHQRGPRSQRPFVAVNCGAIPAELLESELFGHEKGAFTGAIATRKGRFEIADGGTLFLDEIGDMSMVMQVKLLRVLQERVFERVGSQTPMRCNVRIIAATHRNLEEAIARGTFREDLFYRLNVFPIEMPSLRSRIDDIPLLVRDFIEANVAAGRARVRLSAQALECLKQSAWPGNVRELSNLIERLSILYAGRIVGIADLPQKYRPKGWTPAADCEAEYAEIAVETATVLPDAQDPAEEIGEPLADAGSSSETAFAEREALAWFGQESSSRDGARDDGGVRTDAARVLPADGIDLRAHLNAIEKELIRQALERSHGTVAHAARLLGLRRTTLVEKLRKFDLTASDLTSEV